MNNGSHENLHKEIDIIQACITRMAQNSFMLKGWLITLIAAILILLPENLNLIAICLVSLMPTISFWYLDAFFLRTEKKYRELYNWVIVERIVGNNELLYCLDTTRFSRNVKSIPKLMFTHTLLPFYGIPCGIIIGIIVITFI